MCTCTTTVQSETNWNLGSLLAARRGDGEAFTSLVSPHAPRLHRLARRMTRSHEDAEDVCQESLLKAFTKLDQFDGARMERDAFCAWLMRITANCAIDFLRRKKADRLIPLEECTVPVEAHSNGTDGWGQSPEAHCTRQEQLQVIAEIMAELPAELRNVCLLRNMMELSTNEVAARLGISSNAVRLRLFRAHCQLRKNLSRRSKRYSRARFS